MISNIDLSKLFVGAFIRIWDNSIVQIIGIDISGSIKSIYFINCHGNKERLSTPNLVEILTKEEYPEYYL